MISYLEGHVQSMQPAFQVTLDHEHAVRGMVRVALDRQTAQNNWPYTAYALYFGIFGRCFGHFGGPGN